MKNFIAITTDGSLVVILQFIVIGQEVCAVAVDTDGNIKTYALDNLHIQDVSSQFSVSKKKTKKEAVEVVPLQKYEQLTIDDFLMK